jgi:hypothetical protein
VQSYQEEKLLFLPTKAAMLLEALVQARPDHDLILADFAELPDVQILGRNAPLVTAMVTPSHSNVVADLITSLI